ncbi:MAG: hypothetical protein HQL31_10175, partial [Planctomycetes bacterium]|nr:hypothetical protein [Planctomycetota bacterium]
MRRILIISFLVSFCSIGYEFLIAQTLISITDDKVYWQCVTIGVYMFFLGMGSLRYSQKSRTGIQALSSIELWLSSCGAMVVPLILAGHLIYRANTIDLIASVVKEIDRDEIFLHHYFTHPVVAFGWLCQGMTAVIGFLSGFELPALIDEYRAKGGREDIVLGTSYLACLVATLAFVVFLIPVMGLTWTGLVFSAVNIISAGIIISSLGGRIRRVIPFAILWLMLAIAEGSIMELHRKAFYFLNASISVEKALFHDASPVEQIRSSYQQIDILHQPRIVESDDIDVHLDGHFQFSTYSEAHYHSLMAHFAPSLLNLHPVNVLVLGAGDGLLIRDLLRYDSIQQILNIELDPEITHLAISDSRFLKQNQCSLLDDRVLVVNNDALQFLRSDDRTWDAIYADFPYPYNFDISKLYSKEFYQIVKRHLSPDGYFVLNGPATQYDLD